MKDDKGKINTLNQDEINFFRRVGYLKLQNKFDNNFMDDIQVILNRNLKEKISPYKKDKNGYIIKMFNLFNRDNQFKKLYTSPLIIDPLKSLLGPNIEFLLNRHNHASVIRKSNNEKRFHRDVLHWSRPVIAVLIYPQSADTTNGCTEIIPGSQYLPFVKPKNSDLPKHAGTWLDEYSVYKNFEKQGLPVFINKGEILLFDALLFHTPGINSTEKTRYAITAAYTAVDELLPIEYNTQKVLVAGKRTYCGNEFNWE